MLLRAVDPEGRDQGGEVAAMSENTTIDADWRPVCYGENFQGPGDERCWQCPWIEDCMDRSTKLMEQVEAYQASTFVLERRERE